MREAKKALYALSAAGLLRLREAPGDVLLVGKPGDDPGEVFVRFHLPTGKWKAKPSNEYGAGLYGMARILGLSLKEIAEAFSAS